jgi:hypothetical protein
MELSGICGIAGVFDWNERETGFCQKESKNTEERSTLHTEVVISKIDKCRLTAIIAGLVKVQTSTGLARAWKSFFFWWYSPR